MKPGATHPKTLGALLAEAAGQWPGCIALVQGNQTITYEHLHKVATTFAGYLTAHGHAGHPVALLTPKQPEAVAGFLGAAMAGCPACALDYHLQPEDLARLVRCMQADVLICSGQFAALARASLSTFDSPPTVIVLGQQREEKFPDAMSWEEVLTGGSEGTHPLPDVTGDSVAYLNITSGSTGLPKLVPTTHRNLLTNTLSAIAALGLTHDDIHLSLFPFYGHPHESFMRALALGGIAVLHDTVRPSAYALAARHHRPTVLMAATTIYRTFLSNPGLDRECFASVRLGECGGMHLPASVHDDFLHRFGVPLIPVWGSTETSGIALALRPDAPYVPDSAGSPCPGYEALLVNGDGRPCTPGETGELMLRGNGVCEVAILPDGSRKPLLDANGWHPTGDLFMAGDDGHYFFKGRLSGMLKVAGMRVYPMEVENMLLTHPDVSEAAVTGAQHPSRGEVPVAYVVLHPGTSVTPETLRDHCRRHLAGYKVPRAIYLIDSLPKSPGGKILYRLLPQPDEIAADMADTVAAV